MVGRKSVCVCERERERERERNVNSNIHTFCGYKMLVISLTKHTYTKKSQEIEKSHGGKKKRNLVAVFYFPFACILFHSSSFGIHILFAGE